jgi:hypoxanthine phosphoribosyltransferase
VAVPFRPACLRDAGKTGAGHPGVVLSDSEVLACLDGGNLDELCRELAAAIEATLGRVPDVVVGIAQGGSYVADGVCRAMPAAGRLDVSVRRPGTKVKEALRLRPVLSRLPVPLADLLRVAEVRYREAAWRARRRGAAGAARNAELAAVLRTNRAVLDGAGDIVIVDDTIDSGRTMSTVRDEVRRAAPGSRVWTAVITSTWRRPPVVPDVVLRDRALMRFPWSHDAG